MTTKEQIQIDLEQIEGTFYHSAREPVKFINPLLLQIDIDKDIEWFAKRAVKTERIFLCENLENGLPDWRFNQVKKGNNPLTFTSERVVIMSP